MDDHSAMTPARFAGMIDHTILRADATIGDIEKLCHEARECGFFGVCVNGTWVEAARSFLEDTSIKTIAVAGFPLGAMSTDAKRYEVEAAVDDGAQEVDVVLNVGRLKGKEHQFILRELRDIVESADERPLKVIIETGLLTREEKLLACQLVVDSGAKFVKTSTGFGGVPGALAEDVALIRETVGPGFGVKASGGLRDAKTAFLMMHSGANRIGTSAGVAMLREIAAQ